MSYHVPRTGEEVIFIDSYGAIQTIKVLRVSDVQAGVIVLPGDLFVRYVDPSGATDYEKMTWHHVGDDVSRIANDQAPMRMPLKVDKLPEYAKTFVKPKPHKTYGID